MQVTVEDVSGLTKKMTIVLPHDKVTPELEGAYGKLSSEVSIKGFRKGKVPRKVLEKNYGEKVKYDLAEKLIQDTYFDALGEVNIDAVVHPEIKSQSFKDDGSFVYEAMVDVRPEFELCDYKGLEIEQDKIEVADADVDAELEEMRKQMAPLRNVDDRTIQTGDVVVLDFQGYHGGELMKQVKAEDFTVDVGSGRFGKDFEDNLIGLDSGEKTTREIDFPATFPNPVMAGKKVEFKIDIKDVKERVLAELDDEFAKDCGKDYKTLADLKKNIIETRKSQIAEQQTGGMNDKVMMKLLENHEFDVPPRLVAHEINSLIKEMEDNLFNQKQTLESAGLNRDELVEQYKDVAEKRVRGDFVLKKIAEKEEIKLDDDDVEKGFARVSEKYNMEVAEVKKYFSNRDDLLPFMNELLSEKILQFLKDEAKVTYVVPTTEEDAKEEKTTGEK